MALFGNKNEGGLMDVIRCDEQEYLVWKWRPKGATLNDSKKENAIRWGSSLRVKDGEVAVFVYKQSGKEDTQEFIVGPHDDILKTANLPIISSIIGLAYAGGTPFQAEVYFINLAGNNQLKFGVPYFDVFDPRFQDLGIPVSVRGSITFNLTDYKAFIKLNRLVNFELEDFKKQIKDNVVKNIKGIVTNIPQDNGMPVLQMERKILEINDVISPRLKDSLENVFGVNMKLLDISSIEIDKEHGNYEQLKANTAGQQSKIIETQTNMNLVNQEEMLRIQRKDAELGVEEKHIDIYKIDKQSDVLKTAAENLGEMSNINLGGGGGGMGFNPAGLMTGIALGGVMGNQMGGMMNNLMGNMNNSINQNQQNLNQTPPPPIQNNNDEYFVTAGGQNHGPFNLQQLQAMIMSGQITPETYAWKKGMQDWIPLKTFPEFTVNQNSNIPPPPKV
ncbi:MAG: SPFH domain-containing protein [Bacteroidia bacterium]